MNKGPVLIIINEEWEREIYTSIWEDLEYENSLKLFDNAEEALSFIAEEETRPFLIISDVKLPGINGYEFREKLLHDADLKCKTVPFIFRSTIDSEEAIERAHAAAANGYFVKGADINGMRKNITAIIEYWKLSRVPRG